MSGEGPSNAAASYILAVPSLKSIAVVSLVGRAWKSPELQEEIRAEYRGIIYEPLGLVGLAFISLEETVLDTLEKLLPGLLREEAIRFTRPMGLQLFRWMQAVEKHYPTLFGSTCVESSLCWTMHGTIDHEKTLESLLAVKDESAVFDLYQMACFYCLQCHASDLSMEYHDLILQRFELCDPMEGSLANDEELYRRVLSHWMFFSELLCEECELLLCSVVHGNVAAIKFLCSRTAEELEMEKQACWIVLIALGMAKYQNLVYQATNEYADTLCFFLAQMNAERRLEIAKKVKKTMKINLKLLFHSWPWQEFFLPTLRLVWDILPVEDCSSIIMDLLLQIGNGTGDLFREIWQETPAEFKRRFLSDLSENPEVMDLVAIADFRTAELILNNVEGAEHERLTFELVQGHGSESVMKCIYRNKLPFLNTLVEKTLTSESKVSDFKEQLVTKLGHVLCRDWLQDNNQEAIEAFKDWCFPSEQQFDDFKRDTSNKIKIVTDLVCKRDYERMESYLRWSLGSVELLCRFKEELGACKDSVIRILKCHDWNMFEWFLNWCYDSEAEIVKLKKELTDRELCSVLRRARFNLEFTKSFKKWYHERV